MFWDVGKLGRILAQNTHINKHNDRDKGREMRETKDTQTLMHPRCHGPFWSRRHSEVFFSRINLVKMFCEN